MRTVLPAGVAVLGCAGYAKAAYIGLDYSSSVVSITAGDFELGITANGNDINGQVYSTTPGTPISFLGSNFTAGNDASGTTQIFVTPFLGATYAIAELDFNYSDVGYVQTVMGTFLSDLTITVPVGTRTVTPGNSATFDADFDTNTLNVDSSLGTAVPEPASLAVLGAGLIGAAVARRRRSA